MMHSFARLPTFMILIFNVICMAKTGKGQNMPMPVQFIKADKTWAFTENKGQLADEKGRVIEDVKYYSHPVGACNDGTPRVYCMPGKISFVFTKTGMSENPVSEAAGMPVLYGRFGIDPTPVKTLTNRIDLVLLNSNAYTQVIASGQQEYYENYYLAHTPENGITNVHTFKTVTYKNIYTKIDLVLHVGERGMKYEFVVRPGGRVSDIRMQWNGLQNIKKTGKGGMHYYFGLGYLKEAAPYTYTVSDSLQNAAPIFIRSAFIKKDHRLSFKIGLYNMNKLLVIDPTLEWGTYTGETLSNLGNKIAIDKAADNVFIIGTTSTVSGITTKGAYQTSMYGTGDAYLAKFTADGSRAWATYFGGNGQEVGYGISLDATGNIFIAGYTNSDSGIASSGAYRTKIGNGSNNGKGDGFVAKFSSRGLRLWSTYMGGSATTICFRIASDHTGNVIVTGEMETIPKPVFLAKFSPSGSLTWITYYGGGVSIATPWGIAVDSTGNIYITGDLLIQGGKDSGIATSGAFQTSLGGGKYDAFLAKFSATGKLTWGTFFGGAGADGRPEIAIDKAGNVIIAGYTTSSSGIASTGAYQTSFYGGYGAYDGYIAKFSELGKRLWASYCNNIHPDAVAVDGSGNIYITGSANNTKGVTTPGAFQSAYGGGASDVYIAKYSAGGNRIWGTWYGGGGDDEATGITIDDSANIYITGGSTSMAGIATAGAFISTNNGTNDAFITRFGQGFPHDIGISGFAGLKDPLCPGINTSIIVKLKNFGMDKSVSATIHWSLNGRIQDSVLWAGNILTDSFQYVNIGKPIFINGNDTITAWATLNSSIDPIHQNDTGKIIVQVLKANFAGVGKKSYAVCKGAHIRIGANGIAGNSYSWTSRPSGFISQLPDPIVKPDSLTTFILTETNTATGCKNSDSSKVSVNILPAPVSNPGFSQSVCSGTTAPIGADPINGLNYSWSSKPSGFISSLSKANVKPDTTTTYFLTVTNTNGCTDLGLLTITVNDLPVIHAGLSQKLCSGTPVQLGGASVPGYSYSWTSKPNGFTSNASNPVIISDITRIYFLTATIITTGCTAKDSVIIEVAPKPVVKIEVKQQTPFTFNFNTLNPNYGPAIYKWLINDSDIGSGYHITGTFQRKGSYKIKLMISIPGYCTQSDSTVINFNPQFLFEVFPNPFVNQADIHYILDRAAHIKILVSDMLGHETVTITEAHLNAGEFHTPLSTDILKTRQAMYLIIFIIDGNIITKKIVQCD